MGQQAEKKYIFDPQGNKIYDQKKRQYLCNSILSTDWNEQTKAEEWRQGWAASSSKEKPTLPTPKP